MDKSGAMLLDWEDWDLADEEGEGDIFLTDPHPPSDQSPLEGDLPPALPLPEVLEGSSSEDEGPVEVQRDGPTAATASLASTEEGARGSLSLFTRPSPVPLSILN